MHLSRTAALILAATNVLARPRAILISTLPTRRTADPLSKDCNATCADFAAAEKACKVPHCGCNVVYLRAQGECILCQTESPEDAASVQFLLDAEQSQCHREGIPIKFRLHLPPKAQIIVDDTDRQSGILRRQQMAFLALHIAGGHIGLAVMLAFAIFSRRVHRDPTFFNFCLTWILSSVSFSILLYHGTNENTVINSLGFVNQNACLAQAALTCGAQVMTACSTMALVIQLWIRLRTAIHCDILHGANQKQWTTITLLMMPYVLFFAFAIPSVFIGQMKIAIQGKMIRQILPTNFYCSIFGDTSFLRAGYGVTLGLLIVAAVFDALIVSMLYKHWLAFRHMQTMGGASLSALVRIMIFSIYRVVVAITYGVLLTPPRKLSRDSLSIEVIPIWVDMLQATIPLVAFLVLGANTEMLSSLGLWRGSGRKSSPYDSKGIVSDKPIVG